MWAVSRSVAKYIPLLPPLYTQMATEYRWCWGDKDAMARDREVGV